MATQLLIVIFVTVITIFNYSEAYYFIDPPVAPVFELSELAGNWSYFAKESATYSRTMNCIIGENEEEPGKLTITDSFPNGTSTVTKGEIDRNEAFFIFDFHYVEREHLLYRTTLVPIKLKPDTYIVFAGFICPDLKVKGSSGSSAKLFLAVAFRNQAVIESNIDEVEKFQKEYIAKFPTNTFVNCI